MPAGRVVVITGASSGLGRAAAIELARRGNWLVLAARRRDAWGRSNLRFVRTKPRLA